MFVGSWVLMLVLSVVKLLVEIELVVVGRVIWMMLVVGMLCFC